jgi:hypothetical protein
VRIRRNQCRGKLADAVFQVVVEGGGRHARYIHQRSRLLGVRTDQQWNIVLLSRSECLVGRMGKQIRVDHRVDDASGIAGKLRGWKLP